MRSIRDSRLRGNIWRPWRSCVIALAACALLLTGRAHAQSIETLEELLAFAKEKTDGVETFTADMSVTASPMGMEMTYAGKMASKGGLSRTTMTIDMMGQKIETVTVVDKSGAMWMEMDMAAVGMGKTVVKMDMSAMAGQVGPLAGSPFGGDSTKSNPTKLLELISAGFDLTFDGPETIDGAEYYAVSGKSKEEFEEAIESLDTTGALAATGMGMGHVSLLVSARSGMTERMSYLNDDGTPSMTMIFKNIETNPELADDLFSYTPPEGVAVMDMSDMAGFGGLGGAQP